MIRSLLSAVLLLCSELPAVAQFLIPSPAPGCLLPANTRLVEVFDVTGPTAGQVHHAPVATEVNAYLLPSNGEWARSALSGACPDSTATDAIAIRLFRFGLAEASTAGKVRTGAYADMEILRKVDGQWHVCFVAEQLISEVTDASDATRHERGLLAALEAAMRTYATARDANALLYKPYAEGSRAGAASDHPILSMPHLPMGFFADAEAFRKGYLHPIPDSLVSISRSGQVRIRGAHRREEDRPWGLSDGERYYIRWGGEYLPLSREGNTFTTVIDSTSYTPSIGLMIGAYGGAIGVGVSMRSYHVELELDMMSGLLSPVQRYTGDGGVLHTIHLSRFAPEGDTATVHFWDQAIALAPDTYCELKLPASSGMELIRVAGPGGVLEMAMEAERAGELFHLIDIGEDGKPVRKTLNPQLQEKLTGRLKRSMRRPIEVPAK